MIKKKVIVIGSGFSGLSVSTCLAHEGYDVTIVEKNATIGGRARQFEHQGFVFDMGPSWYWMPDVFEDYFQLFGKKTSDYYHLKRLDPSYTVVFGKDDFVDLPAGLDQVAKLFESYESGAGEKLKEFMAQAAYKYEKGMHDLVYKPGLSLMEFSSPQLLMDMLRMDIFSSIHTHIRKYFSHPKILQIMDFPVLFLGAIPQNTPALYSLMNYADIALGTWYPMGGMFKIVEGMASLAAEKGVKILTNHEVKSFEFENGKIKSVVTTQGKMEADIVVAGADYHHIDQQVLPENKRNYDSKYWEKRVMAPSSLLFYLGVNKRLKNLNHHNLFFDEDLAQHAHQIYTEPAWPSKPLFYVSVPSLTDPSVAPEGCENVFILIPTAPGLEDSEEVREKYFKIVMDRLETLTDQNIRDHVVYNRSYAHKDFVSDYHAFKGNAYGLANTLTQTAILKPSMKSKKIKNLYFTGQLTVPGPGVPPSLISGQVVAKQIIKEFVN